MITERTFKNKILFGINISFNHKISICRYIEIIGQAFHQFNFLFTQESGKQKLIHTIRQRGCSRIRIRRITTDGDTNGHAFTQFFILIKMTGRHFMTVPVHAGHGFIKNLHPVKSDVADSGMRIACLNNRQGHKRTTILRPAG